MKRKSLKVLLLICMSTGLWLSGGSLPATIVAADSAAVPFAVMDEQLTDEAQIEGTAPAKLSVEKARLLAGQAGGTSSDKAGSIQWELPGNPLTGKVSVEVPADTLKFLIEKKLALNLTNQGFKLKLPDELLRNVYETEGGLELKFIQTQDPGRKDETISSLVSSDPLKAFAHYNKVNISYNHTLMIKANISGMLGELTLPISEAPFPLSDVVASKKFVIAETLDNGTTTLRQVDLEIITEDGRSGEAKTQVQVDSSASYRVHLLSDVTKKVIYSKYISGLSNGEFQPDKGVTRAEMAMMLVNSIGLRLDGKTNLTYKDVPFSHWAYSQIQLLSGNTLKGDANGYFYPNRILTRAEAAAIMVRFLLLEVPTGPYKFKDMQGHWGAPEIQALINTGLMKGDATGFHPDRPLTRAEAVVVLNQLSQRPAFITDPGAQWSDVPRSHWAYKAIQSASVTREVEFTWDGVSEHVLGK